MISREMTLRNRQDFPGSAQGELFVVATPIGNLEDASPRMRRILEDVDVLLCEDTRRTSQLMLALNLKAKKFERVDAHVTSAKVSKIIELLSLGQTMALVSDAGTPGVSDPGAHLVEEARKAGIKVTPIPGPSAPIALLSVAGFAETAFTFRGFFPRKEGERTKELQRCENAHRAAVSSVFVWFESPERIGESLAFLATLAPQLQAIAGKELTKLFEKWFSGSLSEVAEQVLQELSQQGARGEWCFALFWKEKDLASFSHDQGEGRGQDWEKALKCVLKVSDSPSQAAKWISQEFGIPKNTVYARALEIAGKKESHGA